MKRLVPESLLEGRPGFGQVERQQKALQTNGMSPKLRWKEKLRAMAGQGAKGSVTVNLVQAVKSCVDRSLISAGSLWQTELLRSMQQGTGITLSSEFSGMDRRQRGKLLSLRIN